MKIAFHVFKHEINKILSDKKLLISMIIMPILIVFMMGFLTSATSTGADVDGAKIYTMNGNITDNRNVYDIVNSEYTTFEELDNSLELNDSDVVIDLANGQYLIYYNQMDETSTNLAMEWSKNLHQVIAKKFIGVEYSTKINTVDLNDKMEMSNLFIATMLPYMLVLLLFQNSSNYAIDTIAGEKERGAFAKNLLAPVSPIPIVSGKIMSSTVCGIISCLFYFAVVIVSESILGIDTLGLQDAKLTFGMVISILFCGLVLSYMFATLGVLYSLMAKRLKTLRILVKSCWFLSPLQQ